MLILGNLPTDIRSGLERNIRAALDLHDTSPLVHTNSANTPNGHTYSTIHFDYYCRNTMSVSPFLICIQNLLDIFIREMVHQMMCIQVFFDARTDLVPIIFSLFLDSLLRLWKMKSCIQVYVMHLKICLSGLMKRFVII